jgi:opacity protein-like surface antigen
MKKSAIVLLSTLGLAAFGASAMTMTNGNFYASAQMGYSAMNISGFSASQTQGLGYRVSGGYLVNLENNLVVGAELGYVGIPTASQSITIAGLPDFGIASTTITNKFTGYAIDLLGVAKYTFAKQYYLIGKIGAASVSQTASALGASATETNIQPEFVGGIGYNFTKNISADVTYNYIAGDASGNNSSTVPVSSVLAGVTYNF